MLNLIFNLIKLFLMSSLAEVRGRSQTSVINFTQNLECHLAVFMLDEMGGYYIEKNDWWSR